MGVKRQILFFLCISFVASSCFGSWFKKDYFSNPKALEIINQEVQATRLAYNTFFQQQLIPQMKNGAGRDQNAPIVIPAIYGNNQFTPGGTSQMNGMLEPVARSVAYAGLFCEGVGLVGRPSAQPLYINFVTFSTSAPQGFNGVAGMFSPQGAVTVEITRTTVQCKDFLQKLCINGACSSGKCGQSKVLGSFCDELCQGAYSAQVSNCRNDFYRMSMSQQTSFPNSIMQAMPQQTGFSDSVMQAISMPSVPPVQSYVPPIQAYLSANPVQALYAQERPLFYGQPQMGPFMNAQQYALQGYNNPQNFMAQQNMGNYPQGFYNQQGYY